MIPDYLNKIRSDKRTIECGNIFNVQYPTPSELRWLVKFLKFVGYSKREVKEIIRDHAQWSVYSLGVAKLQIEKIYCQREVETYT
jgi:hypothetical protein